MGFHPANLAFRFLLELLALVAMGLWGWSLGEGILRYVFAGLVPIAGAALWGTFAVPGDPSRSGSAPVAISGALRLVVETVFFSFACWALYQSGNEMLAAVFVGAIAIHYLISHDRVAWLLRA